MKAACCGVLALLPLASAFAPISIRLPSSNVAGRRTSPVNSEALDVEGVNNIIPKGSEQGDQGIKAEVFARPAQVIPDQILLQKTSAEVIPSVYPQLSKEYLEVVQYGAVKRSLNENDLLRKLAVAQSFARMANIIVVMRGEGIVANDFKYYSPSTGVLNKDEFLGLLRTVDRAFPALRTFPGSYTAYKDGVVSFTSSYRAVNTGVVQGSGGETPPTGTQVISDVELSTVAFDAAGMLKSYTAGVVVANANEYKDPAVLERIEFLTNKIASNKVKILTLAGQEHTIAYQKSIEEVNHLAYDLSFLKEQVNVEPNTKGRGGYEGLFRSAGQDWPSDIRDLIQKAPHKAVGGYIQGGMTSYHSLPMTPRVSYAGSGAADEPAQGSKRYPQGPKSIYVTLKPKDAPAQ